MSLRKVFSVFFSFFLEVQIMAKYRHTPTLSLQILEGTASKKAIKKHLKKRCPGADCEGRRTMVALVHSGDIDMHHAMSRLR